jgi:hypothetical protein
MRREMHNSSRAKMRRKNHVRYSRSGWNLYRANDSSLRESAAAAAALVINQKHTLRTQDRCCLFMRPTDINEKARR